MKNTLKTLLAACALLGTVACEKDEILDQMSVAFEQEAYTVAPLETLEIPFTVTNAGGALDASITASDNTYKFQALMSGRNTGSILFVAPDVNTESKTIDVTLTVASSDGSRTASAAVAVTISTSNALGVAFEQSAYNLIGQAGDALRLAYDVKELGYATIEKIDVDATDGWKAEAAEDGYVTLTVPENGTTTTVSLTVTDNFGRSASTSAEVVLRAVTTLTQRANCHLVAPGSIVRFDASHRGNSDLEEDRLESVSAELLWQDAKGLIEEVSFDIATQTIQLTVANISGNALVAVRSLDGQVLWSWHIWVTDYDPMKNALEVRNFEGSTITWVYMNRDLGATTDDWKSIDFMGLYYQWGRKDPFPRLASHETMEARPLYDITGSEVKIEYDYVRTTDNLKNAILHPTTFYGNESNNVGDWYTTALSTHNNDLWGGSATTHCKTIYDPCPAGWRVPENDYKTTGIAAVQTYCGYFAQLIGGDNVDRYAKDYYVAELPLSDYSWYFPFSGRMNSQTGEISIADSFACYWTANHYKTASSYGAYYFTINTFLSTGGKANTYEKRACGHAVRCVIDKSFE